MNILFPMNGLGQRFSKEGYLEPKPLIRVNGLPMAVAVLKSFDFSSHDKIYIPYHRKLGDFNFEEIISRNLPVLKDRIFFYNIPFDTNGAAETLKESVEHFNLKEESLLIADCDTIYHEDVISKFRSLNYSAVGYSFDNSPNPIYSYIVKNEAFKVSEIKEKVKISDFACNGIYYFNASDLSFVINELKEGKVKSPREIYISDLFAHLLSNNHYLSCKQFKKFSCVGTPLQLQSYCGESSKKLSEMRFCIDLDNTLVSPPEVHGDYSTVKPLNKNIEFVKKLKSNGAYIIIHSARRMLTHNGNVGKVVADISLKTINTLNKYDIPYDELIFGKPYAHFYIDDLAISADTDLSKATGFYFNRIESRAKHEIKYFDGKCVKIGKLSGESFWYDNCPEEILNRYFPKIYSNSEDKIEMDEINDLSLSHLYVRGIFDEKILENLFKAMDDFHNYKPEEIDFDLTDYYKGKLQERAQDEIFQTVEKANSKMKESIRLFSSYTVNPEECCLIHGDPVFSNIFYSYDGSLKFIDPRGMVGHTKTVYGHILYDYAKIYQSILGYDYILLNRKIDQLNINKFKLIFDKLFLQRFDEKKLLETKEITKSLIISLLPLHHKEKADRFLDLI